MIRFGTLSRPVPCCKPFHNAHSTRPHRHFATSRRHAADFTHTVIGAGAIGLAVARRLQQQPNTSVLLLERHRAPGTETSSRNSEVVHAALYYGHGSLKTALCLRGKRLMYQYCEEKGVPIKRCGKWLVAQDEAQLAALENVQNFAKEVGDGTAHDDGLGDSWGRGFKGDGLNDLDHAIPMRWISRDEAQWREPDVRAEAGVLESSSTGIVDSHAYMQSLLGDFEEAGGTVAFGSDVRQVVSPSMHGREWEIYTAAAPESIVGGANGNKRKDESHGEEDRITTETIINSAGNAAIPISNAILPAQHPSRLTPAYAKGTYYSYSPSHPRPSTLIYPAPVQGHGGLGTHLTLSLDGRVRFGPDVEWIDDPNDLRPNDDPERFEQALDDIQTYLPRLQREGVSLDYCGVRPKLRPVASATAGPGFEDFYIKKEDGVNGVLVNLLGMESPGLTASFAIAEYVHHMLHR